MKFATSHILTPTTIFLAVLAFASPVRLGGQTGAPKNPDASTTIEIVNGKISGVTENGKPVPATLRNVVQHLLQITKRQSYVAVTFVGVEDLLIDKLTLQIASRPESLDIALAALGEASGRKFRAQRFGDMDIMLVSDPQGGPARSAEVFNLSRLLDNDELKVLDRQLEEAIHEFGAFQKNLGDQDGRVTVLKSRMEMIEAQRRKAAAKPVPKSDKLINQIQETVAMTLDRLKSGEKWPEFQFHPGTNLLVVIGSPDAIDITRKVVAALEKTPQ
jgi:hypothetical protein